MQIFSELQRNSSHQIFIKLVIVYVVNFFGSFSPFFPVMVGVFVLCENFFIALIFTVLFTYFHNFNLLFFAVVFLLYRFVLIDRIKDIVDIHYQDTVALFSVYLFLFCYLLIFTNVEYFFLFVYIIYNYAFDLIFIRLIKCELKSY